MKGDKLEQLSSKELAAIIVDALLRSGLIASENATKAIAITQEEIDARKSMGDY